MYKFFLILLLGLTVSQDTEAAALVFDGANDRNSFLAAQAPDSSVAHLTFKGQDIDSEFVEKLESFFRTQSSVNSLAFDGCEFSSNNFHFLTYLSELESFTMTNCNVDPEMVRVVLANLDGYTITSIDFSGNHLLDAASKSIVGGKFGGTIIWGDGTSAFEVTSAHAIASEPSTPRRGSFSAEDDQSPQTATVTPIRPTHPLTQPSSAKKYGDDKDDDVAKVHTSVDPLQRAPLNFNEEEDN